MKLASKMLAALGFHRISQAWNGAEAVDIITKQRQHHHIIFMVRSHSMQDSEHARDR